MLRWRTKTKPTLRGSDATRMIAHSLPDQALEAAIAADQILIRFQPQIEPVSGRIVGVEALARWADVAGPEELFARAAAAGLSERLSRTIQRKALQLVGQWSGVLGARSE